MAIEDAEDCLALAQLDIDSVGVFHGAAPALHLTRAVGKLQVRACCCFTRFADFISLWGVQVLAHSDLD